MPDDDFRLVSLRDLRQSSWKQLCRIAGLDQEPKFDLEQVQEIDRRYTALPLLVAIVDGLGLPVWSATMYLARCAMVSRGLTGDTQRTYGESLVAWLRYVSEVGLTLATVNEETIQKYRAKLAHSRYRGRHQASTATTNLRVAVAALFHSWGQKNGFPSPLGHYLQTRDDSDRSLAPRVISRHPRLLGAEEVAGLFRVVRRPYKLAFRWAIVTGLRRFEVANLLNSDLPRPETLPYSDDGLVKLSMRRKGGKEAQVYAPVTLVEETQWYVLTERPTPLSEFEDYVFIGNHGRPLSRQSFSKEFRRCADLIGSDATLHHLRHTYAINVLRYLDQMSARKPDEAENSLKVLQVMMGHAHVETTEIYLTAVEVTSPAVVSALGYLYGATLDA